MSSCKNGRELNDPQKFAKEFCDCMRKNDGEHNMRKAWITCDKEFVEKNRFYCLFKTDLQYIESMQKVNLKTRDSVFGFVRAVDSIRRADCCKAIGFCSPNEKK